METISPFVPAVQIWSEEYKGKTLGEPTPDSMNLLYNF